MNDYSTLHTLLLASLLMIGLGTTGLMVHTEPLRRKLCGGIVVLALLAALCGWSVFHGRWSGQVLGLGIALVALLLLVTGEQPAADEEGD